MHKPTIFISYSHKDVEWKNKLETHLRGLQLHDVHGNVWEWVEDFYNEKIFADPIPPKKGKEHVLKGAPFYGDVKNATYMTHAAGPGSKYDVGFRIVMEIK